MQPGAAHTDTTTNAKSRKAVTVNSAEAAMRIARILVDPLRLFDLEALDESTSNCPAVLDNLGVQFRDGAEVFPALAAEDKAVYACIIGQADSRTSAITTLHAPGIRHHVSPTRAKWKLLLIL